MPGPLPPPVPPPAHQPPRHGIWFALLCVLLLGVFLLRTGSGAVDTTAGATASDGPPRPAASAARAAPVAAAPALAPLPHSPPRRIAIPALRVAAPVTAVDLTSDGSIEAPPVDDDNLAGWYSGAASPGGRGTSVVVGHVDTESGPAVFYRLGSLTPGSRVEVLRADGRTAVFTVHAVEAFPRSDFPADRVYRDGPGAELRLITCGGRYSAGTGYAENVVVSARLTEVR
ncbi:class F sortase [Streptomyces sp. NPDC047315]|uniref:class F sortase n=1 Tax=Streptomyces sp. NPDC047315 TaxID=3155142 RepID=UPI0033D5A668